MNHNSINPNPVLKAFGHALELAINKLLALDIQARDNLMALNGQSIEFTWSGPDMGLRLSVQDGRIEVGPRSTDPDLAIKSSLQALVSFFRPGASSSAMPTGKVHVTGDVDLARRLSQWFDQFHPEMDLIFITLFGELRGVGIAQVLREGLHWARQSTSTMGEDIAEFLRDDSGLLITELEAQEFAQEVDQLRDQIERIEACTAQLSRRLGLLA
jgi:ubiquinone biosynthesis protein UbiJ